MDPYYEAPIGQDFQPPDSPADQWEANGMPFSTADDLRLHTLNQSLSSVDDQSAEGVLFPEEADEARQLINEQRIPLVKKKLATEQLAQQKMRADLTDQLAFEQSVKRANMVDDANAFNHQVAIHVDPLTGRNAHFYPKGQWEQVDFGEPSPVEGAEGLGDSSTGDEAFAGSPETQFEGGGQASPRPPEQLPQPQIKSNPDGSQTMEIWNGRNREVYQFPAGGGQAQLISRSGPAFENPFGMNDNEMQMIRQRALFAAQGDPIAYRHIMRQLVQQQGVEKSRQQRQQFIVEQAEKKQQAAAAAKENQEHGDKWVANYDKYFNSAVSHWEKAHKEQEMPEDVRKRLSEEAKDRADDAHMAAYGKVPESRKKADQAESDKNRQFVKEHQESLGKADEFKIKPLPKDKYTMAEIEAELKRRAAAKQQPAANPSWRGRVK